MRFPSSLFLLLTFGAIGLFLLVGCTPDSPLRPAVSTSRFLPDDCTMSFPATCESYGIVQDGDTLHLTMTVGNGFDDTVILSKYTVIGEPAFLCKQPPTGEDANVTYVPPEETFDISCQANANGVFYRGKRLHLQVKVEITVEGQLSTRNLVGELYSTVR